MPVFCLLEHYTQRNAIARGAFAESVLARPRSVRWCWNPAQRFGSCGGYAGCKFAISPRRTDVCLAGLGRFCENDSWDVLLQIRKNVLIL